MPMNAKNIKRRARVVCTRCHDRKVRCDLQGQLNGVCTHCQQDGEECRRYHWARRRKGTNHLLDHVKSRVSMSAETSESEAIPAFSLVTPSSQGHSIPSPNQTITDSDTKDQLPRGYIGNQSLMSIPSESEILTVNYDSPNHTNEVNSIIRLTNAASTPSKPMAQAFVHFYFAEMFPAVPVINRSEVNPNMSLLLRQALYFGGSLMRPLGETHPANSTPSELYSKVKILIYLNYEHDMYNVLKSLCILSCYSPNPPQLLSLDCPWQWTGMAIRLAVQLGLHKNSTYSKIGARYRRSVIWFLFNNDTFQAACYGRPPALKMEDLDLDLPVLSDFDYPDRDALYFCHFTRLCVILRKVETLNTQQRAIMTDDIAALITSLEDWIEALPEELRLYNDQGFRNSYHRPIIDVYIFYFITIILLYLLPGYHRQSPALCNAYILAASCVARLYEEVLYCDGVSYLLPIHGWNILVAAVPQIYCSAKFPEYAKICAEELDIGRSVLQKMCPKYPSAEMALSKIKAFSRDPNHLSGLIDPEGSASHNSALPPPLEAYHSTFSNLGKLFPFPDAVSPLAGAFRPSLEPEINALNDPSSFNFNTDDISWNFDLSTFYLDNLNDFNKLFQTEAGASI